MFGQKNNTQAPDFEYFTIYDSKVGVYRMPLPATNRFDMVRQIETLFRDPAQANNQLVTHSEDFSVFKIAEFTKSTGVLTPVAHEHVANLHEIRTMVLNTPKQGELRPVQQV